MRTSAPHAADAWLAAELAGKPFSWEGAWGAAAGSVTMVPSTAGLGRLLRGSRAVPQPAVALVAPQAPGLENAGRIAAIDDALCAGLLRGGVHVARVREFSLAAPAFEDAEGYVSAVLETLGAAVALVPNARPALAGSWLAGAAAAVASGRRDDLLFLAMVTAPAPEVMSRRTAENEDDPMWSTSPTLRLADALAGLAPLEAITAQRRPVLVAHGAVDDALPSTHVEAWRSVLAFTGRPVDATELAFADALLQPRQPDGSAVEHSPESLDLLAAVVARWTGRILQSR